MSAISTQSLTKHFGGVVAVDQLDLEVEAGEVFGFLGPNGAGKTTTLRMLVDLLRPTAGRVRVMGTDPRQGGPKLRSRIGYLAGDFVVDGRQTPNQYLTHLAHLRGGVESARISALSERIGLDLDLKIRSLSKGNRQKVGLVQAFMHDPELLVLDEPTSGLDPVVQREFLAMVAEARDRGQTVFMSSHILSEVQHVADRAAIIRDGRLITVDRVEALRDRAMRRIELTFASPPDPNSFASIEGVSEVVVDGELLRCSLSGSADQLVKAAAQHEVLDFLGTEPDLEELFFDLYTDGGPHSG